MKVLREEAMFRPVTITLENEDELARMMNILSRHVEDIKVSKTAPSRKMAIEILASIKK